MGSKHQIQLINQALSAAISSINLARQLLREVEAGGDSASPRELPGTEGKFDGQAMVTADGKKYPVPENYASKSLLVVGDTLKMVAEGDRNFFKQIERVKRIRSEGILTRKEGKWHVVTADGSYRVLPAAVEFHHGQEGDEAIVLLPQDNKRVGFASLEKVVHEGAGKEEKKGTAKVSASVSEKELKKVEKKVTKSTASTSEGTKKTVKKVTKRPTAKKSVTSKSKQIPAEEDLR